MFSTPDDNRQLLRKIAHRDDERLFRKLYDHYYDRFFRIAFYYLQNDAWSQEIVLDIFYKLWENRKDLSSLDNFENYCFILLKNASLNHLKREEKNQTTRLENIPEKANPTYPENELLDEELLQLYVTELANLPERCREVFIRIREEKKSYAEVAAELNISPKTVDAQLQKAVSRLRAKINEYFSSRE